MITKFARLGYWLEFFLTPLIYLIFIVFSIRAGYWVADSPDRGLLVGNLPLVLTYLFRLILIGNKSLLPWQ